VSLLDFNKDGVVDLNEFPGWFASQKMSQISVIFNLIETMNTYHMRIVIMCLDDNTDCASNFDGALTTSCACYDDTGLIVFFLEKEDEMRLIVNQNKLLTLKFASVGD
jgi:hypothetical protein